MGSSSNLVLRHRQCRKRRSDLYKLVLAIIGVCIGTLAIKIGRAFYVSNNETDHLGLVFDLVLRIIGYYWLFSIVKVFHIIYRIIRVMDPSRRFFYNINKITEFLNENDFLEIEVTYQNRIIVISKEEKYEEKSTTKIGESYSIDETEYVSKESVIDVIKTLFPDGMIPVIRIDGLSPEKWRKKYWSGMEKY